MLVLQRMHAKKLCLSLVDFSQLQRPADVDGQMSHVTEHSLEVAATAGTSEAQSDGVVDVNLDVDGKDVAVAVPVRVIVDGSATTQSDAVKRRVFDMSTAIGATSAGAGKESHAGGSYRLVASDTRGVCSVVDCDSGRVLTFDLRDEEDEDDDGGTGMED